MNDFWHSNSQLLLCNKPLPKCSQLLLCWGGGLAGPCQAAGRCGSSASYCRCWGSWMALLHRPLLLLGPVGCPGMLFTSSPRHRLGTGTLSFPKKSCAGQLAAHDEAATGAWMQRGVKSWGQECRLPQLLLNMVISLHCLNCRAIKVLQATCTLGIHRRLLLPGEGQEICTQRRSSLSDVACE